jgi:hypothetical protein
MKQVNVRLNRMLGKITIGHHCLCLYTKTIQALMEGKVETIIVGGSWGGIDYRRSKSNRCNFEPTEEQRIQNLQFVLPYAFYNQWRVYRISVSAALPL